MRFNLVYFDLISFTVEDWDNHQCTKSQIYYRKNNENKTLDNCRKQYISPQGGGGGWINQTKRL